jgi:hypothetical protein
VDPNLIDLAKIVSLEAIKVLGPAIVAGLTGYGAARLQYVGKLNELEKSNEFDARQHLFDYYKSKQVKLEEAYKELSNGLGQALGYTAGAEILDSIGLSKTVSVYAGMVDVHLGIVPFDIDLTLRDMKAKKLDLTEEYRKLSEYREITSKLKPISGKGIESIQANVFVLLEINSSLQICNQLILERQIESIFAKYVKNV